MTEELSNDEINKVAKLSRLRLDDDERDTFKVEISKVLDWVEHLRENVDTTKIEPMFGMGDKVELHTREDVVEIDTNVDDIMSNAPEKMYNYVSVPKVVDSE